MEMAAQRSIAKDVILLGKLAARSAAMIEGEFRRNLTARDFLGEMGSAHYDAPSYSRHELDGVRTAIAEDAQLDGV